MSEKEKPVCARCGKTHWRFVACENAEPAAAREAELAIVREKAKVVPKRTPPPGYMEIGPGKFARIQADRPGLSNRPSYVMVAPGKYRKVR